MNQQRSTKLVSVSLTAPAAPAIVLPASARTRTEVSRIVVSSHGATASTVRIFLGASPWTLDKIISVLTAPGNGSVELSGTTEQGNITIERGEAIAAELTAGAATVAIFGAGLER